MKKILSAVALVGLSACATAAPPGTPAQDLAGTQWRFTMIDGAPPTSDKARLTFTDDRLSANVGCNGMGGRWTVENRRLTAGPVIRTQMYCHGPVWAQEEAVAALLDKGADIVIQENRMTLRSAGHFAELFRGG